jgi:hypothetical protein
LEALKPDSQALPVICPVCIVSTRAMVPVWSKGSDQWQGVKSKISVRKCTSCNVVFVNSNGRIVMMV